MHLKKCYFLSLFSPSNEKTVNNEERFVIPRCSSVCNFRKLEIQLPVKYSYVKLKIFCGKHKNYEET